MRTHASRQMATLSSNYFIAVPLVSALAGYVTIEKKKREHFPEHF
jgi:general stress protein CsbA